MTSLHQCRVDVLCVVTLTCIVECNENGYWYYVCAMTRCFELLTPSYCLLCGKLTCPVECIKYASVIHVLFAAACKRKLT